jgi:hypothetical protein
MKYIKIKIDKNKLNKWNIENDGKFAEKNKKLIIKNDFFK